MWRPGPPGDRPAVLGEVVERDPHLAPVGELEGEVVDVAVALVEEGDDVVVAVGVHPHRSVADPVADPEAEDALVPLGHPRRVGGQVVEVLEAPRVKAGQLVGEPRDRRLAVLGEHALDQDDRVAVGIGERAGRGRASAPRPPRPRRRSRSIRAAASASPTPERSS